MTCGRSHPVPAGSSAAGFTLIELLVVIAVISVLMALLLAALHQARAVAYRVICGGRLRQIAAAWHTYLGDNNQQFLQEPEAYYWFGGWKGVAGGALRRPLNRYAGLPTEVQTEDGARLFRCPADQGDEDYGPVAYLYWGNSYQANLMLIGPNSLPAAGWVPQPVRELNLKINKRLKNLKADRVDDHARLLLAGDHNWVAQWEPLDEAPGRAWHGGEGRYSMAFLDGHVAFVRIRKGVYISSDYRVQPFKELDRLTYDVQSQIIQEAGGGP